MGIADSGVAATATAHRAIDDPVGTYVGPLTISASGGNGVDTVVCRDYQSTAPPQQMPGLYLRSGEVLILASDGICSIDGRDTVHEQIYQTLVFVPTGVVPDTLHYTGGEVAGDLRIGE